MNENRLRAAYHEAGHAVLVHLAGCELRRVAVQTSGQARGHTRQSRPTGRYRWRDYLVITFGGHAAEAIRAGLPAPALDPAAPWSVVVDDDWLLAHDLLKQAKRRGTRAAALLRRCRARAQALLAEPRHWAAVEALAALLCSRAPVGDLVVVDGAEAQRLIADVVAGADA